MKGHTKLYCLFANIINIKVQHKIVKNNQEGLESNEEVQKFIAIEQGHEKSQNNKITWLFNVKSFVF